jgi:conjugal transfer/type IV secretion protein DotA/TraY
MAFLAPVMKGLSIFQVLLLCSIGYSLNLANYVWERGLDFFVEQGGQISLKPPKALVGDSEALARGILLSEVIQEYYALSLDMPIVGPIATESFFPTVGGVKGHYIITLKGPPGSSFTSLGRVRIPCSDPSEAVCSGRIGEVRALMAELQPLATLLAEKDRVITRSDASLLALATYNYELGIVPLTEREDTNGALELQKELGEFKEAARQGGWITAGAYYWTIARLSERSKESLYETVVFAEALELDRLEGEVLNDFDAVLSRYESYVEGAFNPERYGLGVPADFPSLEWFTEKMSGQLGRYGLDRLITQLESGDPVSSLVSLGNFLIAATEAVIGIRVAAMALAYGTGESSSSALGQVASVFTGTATSFVAGVVQGAVLGLGPYILLLSLLLIAYGFMLAYFLPALPFILWISGVLAWLIMVMEALVASPLWLAGHALPEGEGFAGVHGKKGYMLFLGVLLRPPLMVFGFLIAMCLLESLGRVLGHVFAVFGFAFLEQSFLGISGFLAFSVILGIAVISATWKLFGLMGHLPDRILNWIGESIQSFSEREEARGANLSYKEAGVLSTRMLNPVTREVKARNKPLPPPKEAKGKDNS